MNIEVRDVHRQLTDAGVPVTLNVIMGQPDAEMDCDANLRERVGWLIRKRSGSAKELIGLYVDTISQSLDESLRECNAARLSSTQRPQTVGHPHRQEMIMFNEETQYMTPVTTHHDSLGLNDLLVLHRDDRDPAAGNASHHYVGDIDGARVLDIQFQHGARTKPDSVPGCLEGAVITVLIDRLEGMQAGPFACTENDLALAQLRLVRAIITDRAARRRAQGVLGKDAVHKS